MNKKGNIYFGVIIAIIIWVFGILILPFMMDNVISYRANMDCTNSTISDVTKINCVLGETVVPYFIWTIIAIAAGLLIGIKQ